MTEPDPDFLEFFAGEWQELLRSVEIPGMTNGTPSWDRRAAYLLWIMGGHYDAETPWYWRDVMRSVVLKESTKPKPLAEVLTVHKEDTTQFPYAAHPELVGKPSYLTDDFLGVNTPSGGGYVNPADDADCQPDPEGVSFAFDAVKWSGDNG